ncbi:MAG: hypothetical protein ACNA8P_08315, partial [Phycisphaerales bacterium]
PGLRVLGYAPAPAWSDRSSALALRTALDHSDLAPSRLIAWSDRAERVSRHPLSGAASTIRPDAELASPPPPGLPISGRCTRDELGIPHDSTVLIALGAPSDSVDAFAFAYLAGVLSLAGMPVVPIVPARARSIDRAMRFIERHDHAWRLVIVDAQLPELIATANLAAYLPPLRSDTAASDAVPSLRSELKWLASARLPAVIQAEAPTQRMLDALDDAHAGDHAGVYSVPTGRAGLETIRLVEAALRPLRAQPRDYTAEFSMWAEQVTALSAESTLA